MQSIINILTVLKKHDQLLYLKKHKEWAGNRRCGGG
jgi:hypothetical protein